jgi:hypothetical protein
VSHIKLSLAIIALDFAMLATWKIPPEKHIPGFEMLTLTCKDSVQVAEKSYVPILIQLSSLDRHLIFTPISTLSSDQT